MSRQDADQPSAALRKRVLEMAGRQRSPTRDVIRKWRARVFVSGVVASGAMLFVVGGVHPGARAPAIVVLSAAGWAVIAALATWAGFTRSRGMLGLPTSWLSAVALAVGPALLAWALPFVDGAGSFVRGSSIAHAVCFALTLAFAAIPLALMVTLKRRSDPVHPRAAGAALGAAAGAWGSVLIDLHCPITSSLHVDLGHVAPVALFTLLGAVVGHLFLRVAPDRTQTPAE
jgi:hypothetical protein